MKTSTAFPSLRLFIVTILCVLFCTSQAYAKNFLGGSRGGALSGQNAIGFGYYNEPVLYTFDDTNQEASLSRYRGWLIKFAHYFGPTSALHLQYLQASSDEDVRALSGSLVYGMNLNQPGIGAYAGVSYTLKQRTQFSGEQRLSSEKEYGWDYPVGVQVQNGLLTLNFETRYKHFLLNGKNVESESMRYPLYFSVLMAF